MHCWPNMAAKGTSRRLRREKCTWAIQKPSVTEEISYKTNRKKRQSGEKGTESPERSTGIFKIRSSGREKWALETISKCFMGSFGHSHTCSVHVGKLAVSNHCPRKALHIANSSWNEGFCTYYFLFMFEIIFPSSTYKVIQEIIKQVLKKSDISCFLSSYTSLIKIFVTILFYNIIPKPVVTLLRSVWSSLRFLKSSRLHE